MAMTASNGCPTLEKETIQQPQEGRRQMDIDAESRDSNDSGNELSMGGSSSEGERHYSNYCLVFPIFPAMFSIFSTVKNNKNKESLLPFRKIEPLIDCVAFQATRCPITKPTTRPTNKTACSARFHRARAEQRRSRHSHPRSFRRRSRR